MNRLARTSFQVCIADAFETDIAAELNGSAAIDFAWLDGITTDEKWPKFFDRLWQSLNPDGGLVAVHSTRTNTCTRRWLSELACKTARARRTCVVRLDFKPWEAEQSMDELERLVKAEIEVKPAQGGEWRAGVGLLNDVGHLLLF